MFLLRLTWLPPPVTDEVTLLNAPAIAVWMLATIVAAVEVPETVTHL